jgi:prepilin-type N-terminal cleavage/methylation domain-containing protein
LNKKGFTLIEMLVVMSVIGMLSSVIFSAVQSARKKAIDAGVIKTLVSVKTQAEFVGDVYYTNHYSGFCADAQIYRMYSSVNGACNADTNGWAIYAPLTVPPAGTTGWCIDNTGQSKARTAICGTGCSGTCGPI